MNNGHSAFLKIILLILFIPLILSACSRQLERVDKFWWNPSLIPEYVNIKGSNVLYVTIGKGKPIILIHGYGGSISNWEHQFDVFSNEYKLYALDLIGFGWSEKPKINYTPEFFIEVIKEFMDKLHIEKATLMGNSMGGAISLGCAITYPERIDKLVLVDTLAPYVRFHNFIFKLGVRLIRLPILPRLFLSTPFKPSTEWLLKKVVYNDDLITDEWVNYFYEISRLKGYSRTLASTGRNIKKWDKYGEDIGTISKPTLIIWGKEDEIFPVEYGEKINELIKGSKLLVFPECGHMAMWESPEDFNREILSFLSE